MTYLLDTCLISELVAKQPNQRVVDWLDAQPLGSIPIWQQYHAGERGVRESDPPSPHGPELGLGDEGENVKEYIDTA
ncbi:hypothetical protein MC7420_7781 [Coleofasciculus chthonoplastes PCC 7420]|uniref:Uncharacterized protein n=1 Tax=Coleofasciculus chthonoplastes PCC 7420 TaxID=118168 RepID=B4VJF2_9CYAN|nr:hypothetical protein [Coleofasciculus chthonoplastes]EDX78043.1 hypothetical protein MC7420_7781 [Coleofasciculus chthonoplastes PCC 7420]